MKIKFKKDVKKFLDYELEMAKYEEIDSIILSPDELRWLKEQVPKDVECNVEEHYFEEGDFSSSLYVHRYKGIRIEIESH